MPPRTSADRGGDVSVLSDRATINLDLKMGPRPPSKLSKDGGIAEQLSEASGYGSAYGRRVHSNNRSSADLER